MNKSTLIAQRNLNLKKDEQEVVYQTGYWLYQQAKYHEAHAFFLLLRLHEPRCATYYAALAACQKMTQDYEKAINNYAMALLLEPHKIEYRLHIAECQIAGGYYHGAESTLNQLLAENENNTATTQKAQAWLKMIR